MHLQTRAGAGRMLLVPSQANIPTPVMNFQTLTTLKLLTVWAEFRPTHATWVGDPDLGPCSLVAKLCTTLCCHSPAPVCTLCPGATSAQGAARSCEQPNPGEQNHLLAAPSGGHFCIALLLLWPALGKSIPGALVLVWIV